MFEVKNIEDTDIRYSGLSKQGPESLHNYKRTYKEALKRMIATGDYNQKNPIVVPIKEDKRYRSFKEVQKQSINAVIIYMMDVLKCSREEAKDHLRKTEFTVQAYVAIDYYGNGVDAQVPVVLLTEGEKNNLVIGTPCFKNRSHIHLDRS